MISVVVPTLVKLPRLRLTLAALRACGPRDDWEVVLVDDRADGGRLGALVAGVAGDLPLRVVASGGRGRAAARNRGAEAARGDLLVFLDDDIVVTRGFVAAHLAAQTARPGLVHGRLREVPALLRVADPAERFPELRPDVLARTGAVMGFARTYASSLERLVEAMADGRLPAVASWLGSAGANVSLPRPAWERAGGYEERFGTTWGCEDLEMGLRLSECGVTCSFAPAAAGLHLSHERAEPWAQHERNLRLFAALHPRPDVAELPRLLGPDGRPEAYVEAVLAHQRSAHGTPASAPRS